MLNWLFSFGKTQPEYGVLLYGVQKPDPVNTFLTVLKYGVLLVIIPAILTIGVLAYMKKKAYPLAKRIIAVAITLIVYFALLIGIAYLFYLF